jgi:hypothetical protein
MGNKYDPHPDFGITPAQYHSGLSKIWNALGKMNPTNEDVFTLAARAIEEAQQKPSRREIAAMAMQGLAANPELADANVALVAGWAVQHADALIYHLNADPVSEGVNMLPLCSRELDEGLDDDQDRGVSR